MDSYGAERQPIARANAALSVANWHEALRVPQAMGLDPVMARRLQAAVTVGAGSWLQSRAPLCILSPGLCYSTLDFFTFLHAGHH